VALGQAMVLLFLRFPCPLFLFLLLLLLFFLFILCFAFVSFISINNVLPSFYGFMAALLFLVVHSGGFTMVDDSSQWLFPDFLSPLFSIFVLFLPLA
jgi:hypothetical protein